jgi:hypothetical protein
MPAPRPATTGGAAAHAMAVQQLIKKMTRLGFANWDAVRDGDLAAGHPFPTTLLMRHAVAASPLTLAALLTEVPWFLVEADDARFVHAMFRLMRQSFMYKAAVSPEQFLRFKQFASAKVVFATDVATLLARREQGLAAHQRARQQEYSAASAAGGAMALEQRPHYAQDVTPASVCCSQYAAAPGGAPTARGAFFRQQQQQDARVERRRTVLDMQRRALNCAVRVPAMLYESTTTDLSLESLNQQQQQQQQRQARPSC